MKQDYEQQNKVKIEEEVTEPIVIVENGLEEKKSIFKAIFSDASDSD